MEEERSHRKSKSSVFLFYLLAITHLLFSLAHGSNARGVETTATFDAKTDEFVIHTPTDNAQKYESYYSLSCPIPLF